MPRRMDNDPGPAIALTWIDRLTFRAVEKAR
jgi:hypothetical protein